MTQPFYPAPKPTIPVWAKVVLIIAGLLVALVGCTACGALVASTPSPSSSQAVTAPYSPAIVASPPVSGATTTPPTVNVEITTYSAGQFEVGTGSGQIAPGKYRTDGDGFMCMASRQRDNGDTIDFPEFVDGPTFITVRKTDGMVEFTGGCEWTKVTA